MSDLPEDLNNRAWEMVTRGDYEAALGIWNNLVNPERPPEQFLNNRGITLLALRRPQAALDDFLSVRHAMPYLVQPYVGIAYWLMGNRDAACEDWWMEAERVRARVITHADVTWTTPPLLWWAAGHPDLECWRARAEQIMKQRWRTKRCREQVWPGWIIGFLVGEISASDLLAAAKTRYELTTVLYEAQAHFYIGASMLRERDLKGYYEHLRHVCSDRRCVGLWEYHLASGELREFGWSGEKPEHLGHLPLGSVS
jgi:lipoprotein NlpI